VTDITAKRSFGLVLLIPRAVVLLPHKVPRRRRPVALNEAKTVPNLHKRAWRRLDVGIEEPPTEAETVDPVVRLPPRWRKYPSAADGTLATTTARMRRCIDKTSRAPASRAFTSWSAPLMTSNKDCQRASMSAAAPGAWRCSQTLTANRNGTSAPNTAANCWSTLDIPRFAPAGVPVRFHSLAHGYCFRLEWPRFPQQHQSTVCRRARASGQSRQHDSVCNIGRNAGRY